MATKKLEQSRARAMYVEQGKTAKEIALLLKVSEKTMGTWVSGGKWKAAQRAHLNSTKQRAEDLELVISNITEERIALDAERRAARLAGDRITDVKEKKEHAAKVDALDRRAVNLADEISKWSKTREALTGSTISLEQYLNTMEGVFGALRAHDEGLYLKTLDFQEAHVNEVTQKLG